MEGREWTLVCASEQQGASRSGETMASRPKVDGTQVRKLPCGGLQGKQGPQDRFQ